MELRRYAEADRPLTEALESDPETMRELGGPRPRTEILDAHRRRLGEAWWLTIVPEPGGPAVGTIGIWEGEHDGARIHEAGWMVLPAFQGRGFAGAALELLVARARAEPRFEHLHAFPGVSNAASNALCRRAGFAPVGEVDVVFAGRPLRCRHWVLAVADPSDARSSTS